MVTTGLSLFITVVILHLHHKTNFSPVPLWLRRLLCLRRNHVAERGDGIKQLIINTINCNGTMEQRNKIGNGTGLDHSRETMDNLDKEWKAVIRRIDRVCLFVFMFIFSALLIIMVYPYDTSVHLESGKCSSAWFHDKSCFVNSNQFFCRTASGTLSLTGRFGNNVAQQQQNVNNVMKKKECLQMIHQMKT